MQEILKEKVRELDGYITKAEKSLQKAPDGTLVLSKSNGVVQFFHKTECSQKKGKYITSKNTHFIQSLAQKDYDLCFLKLIKQQKKKLCQAIKLLSELDFSKTYSELSEARKRLVHPYIIPNDDYAEQWENVKYEGKEFLDDTPVLMTERCERVHSKTEKILADKFYSMGIPYRYECPLKLRGYGTVYPDFTLLNVRERKEVYLEHFGMMDNPEYCQKAIQKLDTYAKNRIFIGKNLLVTFETFRHPLDMKNVEKMLQEFILSLVSYRSANQPQNSYLLR